MVLFASACPDWFIDRLQSRRCGEPSLNRKCDQKQDHPRGSKELILHRYNRPGTQQRCKERIEDRPRSDGWSYNRTGTTSAARVALGKVGSCRSHVQDDSQRKQECDTDQTESKNGEVEGRPGPNGAWCGHCGWDRWPGHVRLMLNTEIEPPTRIGKNRVDIAIPERAISREAGEAPHAVLDVETPCERKE